MQRFVLWLVFTLFTIGAQANDSIATEFWPGIDVFYRTSYTSRLVFNVAPTTERARGLKDIQVGANIEFGLAPFIRAKSDSSLLDNFGFNYLRVRVGARYFFGVDPDSPYQEWRVLAEVTPVYPLGSFGTVYLRNRGELRWVGGVFSARFRPRLLIEKLIIPFENSGMAFNPFVSVEPFFDTSVSGIPRIEYQVGVSCGLSSAFVIEPSVYFQANADPNIQSVFAPALNVMFFL